MNIPLLNRIRDSGGYTPLDLLSAEWPKAERELRDLESFGFQFSWHPYLGIAYVGPADRLCPDQIEHELGTRWVGQRIAVWDRVTSTNDLAARAAKSETNDGLVILAESQTAGRGRRGRQWSAPAGSSILASVLLFPPGAISDVSWLTTLGAVAVAEAAEAELGGIPLQIKWPNDVRYQGRKLAGVLVERKGPAAIVGIGVNVNVSQTTFPPELQGLATSLQILANRVIDRSEFARRLISRLDFHYGQARQNSANQALNQGWRNRLEPLGRMVRLQVKDGILEGRLLDADLESGVVVLDAAGATHQLSHDQILGFEETARIIVEDISML